MEKPGGEAEKPGQSSFRSRLAEHVTLTRVSVVVGIVASLVGIAAAFGLVGGGDSEPESEDTSTAETGPSPSEPVAGAVYSGETDQGEPMHFRVYVDGRTIRDLTVPMEGECSDGGPFTSTYRQGEATSFLITGANLSGSSSITGATGEIVGGIFRIEGRFEDGGRTVSGEVSEHAEIKDGSTCDTAQIGFTAAAENR